MQNSPNIRDGLEFPTTSTPPPPALYENEVPDHHTTEKFNEETVEAYQSNPDEVTQNETTPARHYAQSSQPPSVDQVKTLFSRLEIPTSDMTFLVYAGYTGELANVFDELGNTVIFTDPMETWVENAAEHGFETHQTTLEACPGTLFAQADSVVTFEGYMPIDKSRHSLYEGLRSLTAPHGLVFFESEMTRAELKDEGGKLSLKSGFKPFEAVYGVERRYRERDGLRAYHIRANERTRSLVALDANVVAGIQILITENDPSLGIYRENPSDTEETVMVLADRLGVNEEDVLLGLRRIKTLAWEAYPTQLKQFSEPTLVQIGPSQFALTEDIPLIES